MDLTPWRIGSVLLVLAACFSLVAPDVAHAGDTLTRIKARGKLRCGVSDGIPGYSWKGPDGPWSGMDVDFCRALSAAVLGNADKVDYIPLSAAARFSSLKSGELDVLSRNTTWTMEREAVIGILFAGVFYYDRQGFLVPTAGGVKDLSQLNGATICVVKGTTHGDHLASKFASMNWTYRSLEVESRAQAAEALYGGKCGAFTSESPQLRTTQLQAPGGPDQYAVLKETIAEEPMGPVVRRGDEEWFTIVRWMLFTLIRAEELGYTQGNVESRLEKTEDSASKSWNELSGLIAKSLGIDPGWGIRAVKSVGNYGEIFERNLGAHSELKLERGLNKLWQNGGRMHTPPFR